MNLLAKNNPLDEGKELIKQLYKVQSEIVDLNPAKHGERLENQEKQLASQMGALLAKEGYFEMPFIMDHRDSSTIRLSVADAVLQVAQGAQQSNTDAIEELRGELSVTPLHLVKNLPGQLAAAWAKVPGLEFAAKQAQETKIQAESDVVRADTLIKAWESEHTVLLALVKMTDEYNFKKPDFPINGFAVLGGSVGTPDEMAAKSAIGRKGEQAALAYIARALK
jgi:hypothetical protein